jgi:hypothetical protein
MLDRPIDCCLGSRGYWLVNALPKGVASGLMQLTEVTALIE